jgi:hypothetical protein
MIEGDQKVNVDDQVTPTRTVGVQVTECSEGTDEAFSGILVLACLFQLVAGSPRLPAKSLIRVRFGENLGDKAEVKRLTP